MLPSSVATASLAKRLRELRRTARLTQSDVVQALSDEEPVSVSALSAWENVKAPTLPPPDRLGAYARFFATERSFQPRPHLIPRDDLIPEEQHRANELERELLKLRDADSGDLSLVPQSWRFDDGARITIICSDLSQSHEAPMGHLSQVDDPNYTALYSFADLDALVALLSHLSSRNPDTEIHFRSASQTTENDLTGHLVVLGGIAWNDVTRRLNDSVDLPVKQVFDKRVDTGEIFEIVGDSPDHGKRFLPRWKNDSPGTEADPGVLLEDVGMLARVPNPYNSLRTLTYCNGVHSRGVLGAVRCLIDESVRSDNERFLEKEFHGLDSFAILMRVPVLGRLTASPSLSDSRNILFKWAASMRNRQQ
jgi:transcriptional regulator with XRE-family HTH domain